MLNVSEATKDAFRADGVHKEMRISFPDLGLTLSNNQIVGESFKLKQAIQTNGDMDFCGCIASTVSFGIEGNIYELAGQRMTIQMRAGDTEWIPLFAGYVDSSEKKGINEITKTITAYDFIKIINEADVTNWYQSLKFPMKIKALRDAFFDLFGYTQRDIKLINDDVMVQKGDANQVAGKDILNAICQLNACFGQFGYDGTFKYIYLDTITEGLYPADDLYPRDDLYPSSENSNAVILQNDKIIDCHYEDYRVKKIDRVLLMTKEGAIGGSAGNGDNTWQVTANILSQGFSEAQYREVTSRMFEKVKLLWYCVAKVKAMGNPIYECGDVMVFRAKTDIMRSYILERSLSGIQNLIDEYEADGDYERNTQYDSIQAQIEKLSQRTSVNSRDISTNRTNISENTTRIGNLNAELINTNNLVAQKASITDLQATNARVGNLEADHVSVGELNAVSARIGTLEADHVSVGTINALSATVKTINANYITASYVNATNICAALNSPTQGTISIGAVRSAGYQYFDGQGYKSLSTILVNIDGTNYHFLGYRG